MRLKLLKILTLCFLLVLCGCGREEEFAIEGKWKNVGEYTFGQAQEGAIIAFDGTKCNLYSPSDTYAFYRDGDSYILECTSLNFAETLVFDVEIIDADHINLHYGDGVLELQRPGSDSAQKAKRELTPEEKTAKKQALQFVMYEDLTDENGTPVYSGSIDIGESDLRGKMVIYSEDDVLLDGLDIKKAEIVTNEDSQNGEQVIHIIFTSKGADKFAEATARAVGKQMGIISNAKLINAPVIKSEIKSGECEILMSSADSEEVQMLIDALN